MPRQIEKINMDCVEKAKVLIVDDIPSNIEFVINVLQLENLNYLAASNAEEALNVLENNIPDLILLDISMPGMDGYELCRRLKQDAATRDIPVIFLTARVQKDDILKGFKLGAVDYIVKPFNYKELVLRVKAHLELRCKSILLKDLNEKQESIIAQRTLEIQKGNESLQEANSKLRNANKQLSKIDKIKSEFVLHINHELRTPLNGIIGQINLLKDSLKDVPTNEHLDVIEKLAQQLIKVSELSLFFTELNARNNQFDLKPINLKESLTQVIESCAKIEKDIEFEIQNPFPDLYVTAASKLLFYCIEIVLDNAIKYSPSKSTIKIIVKKVENEAIISFIDQGPGFSQKSIDYLFDFLSADNLNYNTLGFGIGLATAKKILDIIGGKITASNNQPNGAKVDIKLVISP